MPPGHRKWCEVCVRKYSELPSHCFSLVMYACDGCRHPFLFLRSRARRPSAMSLLHPLHLVAISSLLYHTPRTSSKLSALSLGPFDNYLDGYETL